VGDKIYVANFRAGLSISNNGGKTWVYNSKPNGAEYANAVAAFANNVYVGTEKGVVISNDGGVTWSSAGGLSGFVDSIFVHCV